jgi:hypothetical protein
MRRLILAAALAAASMSYALAPAAYAEDPPLGVESLGIDLSGVNISPAGVHTYLAQQTPAERRALEDACQNYNAHPAGVDEATLAFCADVGKA